jgi:lysozyme
VSARKTAITVASAAAIAAAVPAVKAYEGLWLTTKVDRVGTGQPCTGGYGETENVRCGETHTEKYWSDRLAQRLPEYDAKIAPCIHVDLPDNTRAALISAAYNAGPGAVCRSPMVAKMNAGDIRSGCESFLTKDAQGHYTGWYIRARGRVVQGLINRRANERKLCLSGLEQPKPVKKAWWQK